jgi:hypothetical protein
MWLRTRTGDVLFRALYCAPRVYKRRELIAKQMLNFCERRCQWSCLDAWMEGGTDGKMKGERDGWMHGRLCGWMH